MHGVTVEQRGSEREAAAPSSHAPPPPDADKSKPRPMTRHGMLVAVSYMTCAVTLVLFNKAALSTYKFPCANVITLLQAGEGTYGN
eukprot:SM007737S22553  [mRNA]  locus=s7737:61:686:+ [translate_table: standard]